MSRYLHCDRCRMIYDLLGNDTLPDNWVIVDKSELCPQCFIDFENFMRGSAVKAVKRPHGAKGKAQPRRENV